MHNLEMIAASKGLRSVAVWSLETVACGVRSRHNRQLRSAIRQVCTASASVVGQLNAEEVLVGDEAAMACGLSALHHEEILGGVRLLNTSFVLERSRRIVSNL